MMRHRYMSYCANCDWQEDGARPVLATECPRCHRAGQPGNVRYLPDDDPDEVKSVVEHFRAVYADAASRIG